ncbi:OmpP1/FadL family transporter [Geomonas sp. RF6]|uniref:OmpP1/FadL family transporter n=1 Tax=Geomonas sp. RF6 TaxID=2897342 RepID=UPI001E34DCC5|nr:OmpP1/FadL family transporter [Geomonas sp. RF6]UFS70060.1 OmpP1/FadL family transporter [Geomonas sp. RF6]
MKVQKRALVAALLTAPMLAAIGSFSTAHASGFAVFTQGASALGQGNAVTAHADDPSAVFYNPALINKLPGTQVFFGSTLISTSREFRSSTTGTEYEPDAKLNYPTTLYVTSKLNDKWSVGLGVFNPFGLKTNWGTEWEGRYLATKSELTTYNVNPVVSYRITPALTFAAGVDVVFLDAKLEKRLLVPVAPGVFTDASNKFEGDGTGVGYNVGVAYDINKDLSVGLSYRSQVDVDVDGTGQAQILATGTEIVNAPGHSKIKLPQQLTGGIAYRVTEPLIVEAGFRWEGWSSFDELAITVDTPTPTRTVTRRDWSDAWGANVGAKYKLNPNVSLLAGYVYGSTPVPDSTFDPTIPDADTHIFTVGTDMQIKKFRVALAYGYQKLLERTKDNDMDPALPAGLKANGTYNTDAHLFGFSLTYPFR